MFKLIAIYDCPEDIHAFEKYYHEVHIPICKKMEGLKEMRLNKIFGAPTGNSLLHMISEMVWEDKAAWKRGMASPACMESGKDLAHFAKGKVSIHFAEETRDSL